MSRATEPARGAGGGNGAQRGAAGAAAAEPLTTARLFELLADAVDALAVEATAVSSAAAAGAAGGGVWDPDMLHKVSVGAVNKLMMACDTPATQTPAGRVPLPPPGFEVDSGARRFGADHRRRQPRGARAASPTARCGSSTRWR